MTNPIKKIEAIGTRIKTIRDDLDTMNHPENKATCSFRYDDHQMVIEFEGHERDILKMILTAIEADKSGKIGRTLLKGVTLAQVNPLEMFD